MRAVFAIDEEESEEEAGRSRSPERSPRRAPQPPLTPQPPPTPPPPQALAPLKLVKQPSELFIVSHGKLGIELGVDHETMSMLITNVSDDGAVRKDCGHKLCAGDLLMEIGNVKLPTSFDLIDEDHDGVIDADELRSAFATLGHPIGRPQAVALLAKFDVDGDGSIGREEFYELARDRMLAIVVDTVVKAPRPLRIVFATPDHAVPAPGDVNPQSGASPLAVDPSLGFTAGIFVPLAAADLALVWQRDGCEVTAPERRVVPFWVTPDTSDEVIVTHAAAAEELRSDGLPSKLPPPGATELVFVFADDGSLAWREHHATACHVDGAEPCWRNHDGAIVDVRGTLRTMPMWRSVADGRVTTIDPNALPVAGSSEPMPAAPAAAPAAPAARATSARLAGPGGGRETGARLGAPRDGRRAAGRAPTTRGIRGGSSEKRAKRDSMVGAPMHASGMRGMLAKLGMNVLIAWQPRWFEMQSHYLCYKKKRIDADFAGGIDLHSATVQLMRTKEGVVLKVSGLDAEIHDVEVGRQIRTFTLRAVAKPKGTPGALQASVGPTVEAWHSAIVAARAEVREKIAATQAIRAEAGAPLGNPLPPPPPTPLSGGVPALAAVAQSSPGGGQAVRRKRASMVGRASHSQAGMNGVLLKMGMNMLTAWQPRWFEMQTHYLCYKKRRGDTEFAGGVDIQSATVQMVKEGNAMMLKVSGLDAEVHDEEIGRMVRTFTLKAKKGNAGEPGLKEWYAAIVAARGELRELYALREAAAQIPAWSPQGALRPRPPPPSTPRPPPPPPVAATAGGRPLPPPLPAAEAAANDLFAHYTNSVAGDRTSPDDARLGGKRKNSTSVPPKLPSRDDAWYYSGDDGALLGPYPLHVIHEWFKAGHFAMDEHLFPSSDAVQEDGVMLYNAFAAVGLSPTVGGDDHAMDAVVEDDEELYSYYDASGRPLSGSGEAEAALLVD